MLPCLVTALCIITAPLRPLPFFYDLYTFRGPDAKTTVVAAFAVKVDELEREKKGGAHQYRFDVSFVLSDTVRGGVSRSDDSVFVRTPDRLDGDHLLHTHVEIQARPSRATWQRVVMTDPTKPGIGQLYHSLFPVPDYTGDDLMLSDVALGQPGAEIGWERGDVTLALLPTSLFPESAFDVYYEIYNLPRGHPFTTEVVIEPVGPSGEVLTGEESEGRAVRTLFTGESSAGPDDTLGELRRVQSALPEGNYRLTVTVTDGMEGETATSSRDFQVREWAKGATMVPALPRGAPKTVR